VEFFRFLHAFFEADSLKKMAQVGSLEASVQWGGLRAKTGGGGGGGGIHVMGQKMRF